MKVKISELRAAINKFLTEALAEIEQEDVDRLRRAKDGYGETEFEEDVDRLRRAADGYGETAFEEGTEFALAFGEVLGNEDEEDSIGPNGGPPEYMNFKPGPKDPEKYSYYPPQSNRLKSVLRKRTFQKTHDQTIANDANDEQPTEASIATPPPSPQSQKGPKRDKSQMQGVGPRQSLSQVFGNDEPQKKEALTGPKDPSSKPQQTAQSSAALHGRDKSQMQGVGPRPTMANAFDDLGAKKKVETSFDPNKTAALSPTSPNAVARSQMKADRQATIKQISQDQQAAMEKDGWKFEKDPSGNWMAKPPRLGESEEEGQGFKPKYDGAGNVTNRPGQGFKPSYDKNGNVSNRKYTKDQMKFKDDEKVKEAKAPSDKEEDFIKKNKEDFKKRYGKAYKDRLYATAKEKFRK